MRGDDKITQFKKLDFLLLPQTILPREFLIKCFKYGVELKFYKGLKEKQTGKTNQSH